MASTAIDPRDQLFLIALDTETTGLDHRKNDPIEIAIRIIGCSTGRDYGSCSAVIKLDKEAWSRAHPKALEVNNFSWEEVQEKGESIEGVAKRIQTLISGLGLSERNAKFICQNSSFDRNFFDKIIDPEAQFKARMPYHWLSLESMYHTQRLAAMRPGTEVNATSYSKDAIAKALGLPEEEKPHRAMNGVDHLLLIYEKLVGFPCATKATVEQAATPI